MVYLLNAHFRRTIDLCMWIFDDRVIAMGMFILFLLICFRGGYVHIHLRAHVCMCCVPWMPVRMRVILSVEGDT